MLKNTWLPASIPDNTNAIKIIDANGSHLYLDTGNILYDGISSWWCKPLGHKHPLIIEAIQQQINKFEHHIPANAYNDKLESLSSKLASLWLDCSKVLYASDGTSAIEMAMKLSYETRILANNHNKNKYVALKNSYHGESIFTLSVCGIDLYKNKYKNILPNNYFIHNIPYINNYEADNYQIDETLDIWIENIANEVTAIIIEPLVQGASGMKIISPKFLKHLSYLAQKNDIHLICDEIMVGLGRIGYNCISTELLSIHPHFICFAKNLTAGTIPMSVVLVHKNIVQLFNDTNTAFLHSHTHSCNSTAVNVALTYLNLIDILEINKKAKIWENNLKTLFNELRSKYNFIENTRVIGSIAACELKLPANIINNIFKLGIENQIYLRPIGNTFYVMPPLYNVQNDFLELEFKIKKIFSKL
jgi:adenosylmethionine-8-amino-7-oxononanoate aminotransferase